MGKKEGLLEGGVRNKEDFPGRRSETEGRLARRRSEKERRLSWKEE